MRLWGWARLAERAQRWGQLALGETLLEVAHFGLEIGDPSVRLG